MPGPWENYKQPDAAPWDKYSTAPAAPAKSLSEQIADPSMTPDTGWRGQIERFGQGTAEALTNPILHPIDTARALLTTPPDAKSGLDNDLSTIKNAATHPANTLGQVAGGAILGHVGGGVSEIPGALKDFAAPDVPAQTMKGLRIPAGSKNAEPLLGKVDTAKPYLQGANDLKDLQSRIPAAKTEVYQPYKDFIESNRSKALGDSTVGDLYDRDKEITAQLGQIKNDPMAMQQAAQKGLTQADLIAEQKDIRAKLFPAAEDAGVRAQEINKTYSALKGIEKQIAGKNTTLVPDEPQGFGRMRNLSIKEPIKALDQIKPAAQDILNGRLWGGNPIDTAIQDSFKTAGPKPNLGSYRPPVIRGLLQAPVNEIPLSESAFRPGASNGGLFNAPENPNPMPANLDYPGIPREIYDQGVIKPNPHYLSGSEHPELSGRLKPSKGILRTRGPLPNINDLDEFGRVR